jgi:hypothetical protein
MFCSGFVPNRRSTLQYETLEPESVMMALRANFVAESPDTLWAVCAQVGAADTSVCAYPVVPETGGSAATAASISAKVNDVRVIG